MSERGQLCYRFWTEELAYKSGGDSLIYKGEPKERKSAITVVFFTDRKTVGPIYSCGNIHSVRVTAWLFFEGMFLGRTSGEGSASVTNSSGTYQVQTESVGCVFPDENPSAKMTVVAIQQNPGITKKIDFRIQNVARGSANVKVSVDDEGKLSKIEVL